MGSGRAGPGSTKSLARPEKQMQRPGPKPGPAKKRTARPNSEENLNFWFWTNFWRSHDRQMAMKKFKYVDINTLYEWPEFEVCPLIIFPSKNNWKTNIEFIEGCSRAFGTFSSARPGPKRKKESRAGLFGLARPITIHNKYRESWVGLFLIRN